LGKDLIAETIFDQVDGVIKNTRAPMPELSVEERISSFIEVDQVLTEDSARGESNRCLSCCLTCYDPDAAASTAAVTKDPGKGCEEAA
jgi:formate dehydrogenase beta subunit